MCDVISLASYFLLSSLMVVLWGPLSDAFGQKPFMLLTIFGQTVSVCLSLLIVYFELALKGFAASEFVSDPNWYSRRKGVVNLRLTCHGACSTEAFIFFFLMKSCDGVALLGVGWC